MLDGGILGLQGLFCPLCLNWDSVIYKQKGGPTQHYLGLEGMSFRGDLKGLHFLVVFGQVVYLKISV